MITPASGVVSGKSVRETLCLIIFFTEKELIRYTFKGGSVILNSSKITNSASILNMKLVCCLQCALNPCQLDSYFFLVIILIKSWGDWVVRNQSSKIFLYGISSFQYSLFVPSVDFSSVELSKLVRPMPLLSLAKVPKCILCGLLRT